ncbi:MAG: dephospho-CoA kinase [Burkholderiales bacterium]|nr:dephospho-CoA kinase [Burkholderiales bacterium]
MGLRPGSAAAEPARVRSIGLTGGIGSGKSTVARMLAARGALVVDTDAIARALTAPGGAALPAIAAAFGAEILGADGALDRDRMRALAFADPDARRRLEAILHPMIAAEAEAQAARAGARPVVFDVPLLAESPRWRARVDRVLVVDCPEAVQVERVVRRSGWASQAVERVIAQQATRAARRAIADAVIDNGGATTLAQLESQLDAVWRDWFGAPAAAAAPR